MFRKYREPIGVSLLVIWIIYSLAILLKTGFVSDDAYNSQIKGQIIQQGITLGGRIFSEIEGWLRGAGRLMLLAWPMNYGLYYYTQDLVTVKTLTIAVNIAAILLFYIFAKREAGSWRIALLTCMLVPECFQFRLWHDPILAFTFFVPITFALVMGALVLYQKYLDGAGRRWVLAATCVYMAALLMYEIAVPLCLLFVLLALVRRRSLTGALFSSLPFTGAALLLIVVSAVFRLYLLKGDYAQSTYPGAELHLDPQKFLAAFTVQTIASLPLSYFHFMQDRPELIFHPIDYLAFALFGFGIAALVYRVGRDTVRPQWVSWIGCGAILLFLSAGLTGLSGHQNELIQAGYGFGYIPVYIQYFGLCMFLVALIWFIATRLRWRMSLVVFSVVMGAASAMVAGLNLGLNRAVAFRSNETYKHPRVLLNAALKAGLANDMKDGAFLIRTMRFPSDYTWAFTLATGKTFEVCDPGDAVIIQRCVEMMRPPHARFKAAVSPDSALAITDASEGDVWALSYNFDRKVGEKGRVILGRVERIVTNSKDSSLVQLMVRDVRVYDLQDDQVSKLNLPAPVNFLRVIEDQNEDMNETRPVEVGLQPAGDVDYQWQGRIFARDGSFANNLRWSSGDAKLVLHNMSGTTQTVDISMGLAIATAGKSTVVITYPEKTEEIAVTQIPVDYARRVVIKPGRTEIMFTSNAPEIQNGDPRHIVFGVFNFRLIPGKKPI
jgi:hypothetical protein